METLVLIEGNIVNAVQHTQEDLARFSIENEDGRFYVQVSWSAQLAYLQAGDTVTIIGTLHSFEFSRCRCHHVYIEPTVVIRGIKCGGGEAGLAERGKLKTYRAGCGQ